MKVSMKARIAVRMKTRITVRMMAGMKVGMVRPFQAKVGDDDTSAARVSRITEADGNRSLLD
jgi:hypothetical protein